MELRTSSHYGNHIRDSNSFTAALRRVIHSTALDAGQRDGNSLGVLNYRSTNS
jgi:hypothetical protein